MKDDSQLIWEAYTKQTKTQNEVRRKISQQVQGLLKQYGFARIAGGWKHDWWHKDNPPPYLHIALSPINGNERDNAKAFLNLIKAIKSLPNISNAEMQAFHLADSSGKYAGIRIEV